MANATLQDIAKAVGVSLTTASMALSGKGRISLEVRSKVLAAAGQLGYRSRNVNGRGAQRTRSVGIIHLDDRNHEWNFIRPILFELEIALHREGYAPVMIPVSAMGSTEQALRRSWGAPPRTSCLEDSDHEDVRVLKVKEQLVKRKTCRPRGEEK